MTDYNLLFDTLDSQTENARLDERDSIEDLVRQVFGNDITITYRED
jgi:hypothetical protein